MTTKLNEEYIEKTIETSDFLSGNGLLTPEQQDYYVVLTKRYTNMFRYVRTERMKQAQKTIDKLHFSEPITRGAQESTPQTSPTKVKSNQVTLSCVKVRSDYDISTESLQESIEGDNFELTIMRGMTHQVAQDLEQLAIQGDTDIVGTDSVSSLLKNLDGWYKQSLSARVLDMAGGNIQKGIFAEMKRMMPKQYRNNPNLRFMMSSSLYIDWVELITGGISSVANGAPGADALAESAFRNSGGGAADSPFGTPIHQVGLIPDDQPVETGAAAIAIIDGVNYFPFSFTAANNALRFTVDSGGGAVAIVVDFTPNKVHDGVEVVKAINDALLAAGAAVAAAFVAEATIENKVRIRSVGTGVAQEIVIASNVTSTANETLGFPAAGATINGDDTSGLVPEGTFIWYGDPRNFVWGILDGTRIFTEFNKDSDQIETVIYNQVDSKIENLDSLVLCKNIRRRDLIL